MASTTVEISAIAARVAAALDNVAEALEGVDNETDRDVFRMHADRLTWIAELAEISVDGTITLDSEDMEAIWHWAEASDEAQADAA